MALNIPKWSELPDPTVLDRPSINTEYAAKGWDLLGKDNGSGLVNVGYGNKIFKEIRGLEIPVSKKGGKDLFLAEFETKGIVVANKTRMSLINGLMIKLQERLQFLHILAKEVELVCFVCARYTPFSSVEADHFQSHADIIQRMKAYWEKLDDEDFFEQQEKNPLFNKMFAIHKEHLVMTQFFQRGYVHSEDNLWPLCHDCNSLANKNDTDPFKFLLAQKHYGPEFLRSLPAINATGILIRAGNNQKVLAQFAIEWFVDKMRTQILSRQLFGNLQLSVKTSFEDKVERREDAEAKKLLLRLKVAAEDQGPSDQNKPFDAALYEQAVRSVMAQVNEVYTNLINRN